MRLFFSDVVSNFGDTVLLFMTGSGDDFEISFGATLYYDCSVD